MTLRTLATSLAVLAAGCANGPEPPSLGPPAGLSGVEIGSADLRVLFIGNSLTGTNDLPRVVAALAREADLSFAHATVVSADWSLEEHWAAGTAKVIRDVRADVVVLQQGPSSLPESQTHLAEWAARYAPVIRESGGVPALLMVWPAENRAQYFGDVRRAYQAAAAAIDGVFIPAGQVWVEAMRLDSSFDPWGRDRFHPAYQGTLAAAMTVIAVLYELEPELIPDLPTDPAGPGTVALLRAAVTDALIR